ncbi:MAG: phosphoglycerate dehydrogenase [Deltaproteobacteria bacterium]|nr:phosphoglycerate dehydrogenase [Deltaproteobacteria bacterium]
MSTHVLITGHLHESAIAGFKANKDFHVVYAPDCERSELLRMVPKAQVLVTRSETDVDREVIEHAPELKVIARAAVGVGNIDIDLATQKGILVINCPGKNTNSAAELTLALALAMLRNVPQAHQTMKSGGWDRHRFTGRELRGKRIGIVGLGNVGHRVAQFARGFDMEVYAYDPYIAPQVFERHQARQFKDLDDMLRVTDILTVHVPLNKETKGMIKGPQLDLMPRGSYVLNVARGGVIAEKDLVARLQNGQIAGAGIDTWESEPKPLPDLLQSDKVWCSPHIGASTLEAQIAIGDTILRQVEKAVAGGVVDYPVNLPQVGVIDNPLLNAYAVLAEKLGSLIGQIISFNPKSVELSYRGDLAALDHSIVRLSLMKGYASKVVDGYVSFVNVETHIEKMGLTITESKDPNFQSYKSALKVRCRGADGAELTVGGVVFDDRYSRISLINDFYFELEPTGDIIIVENNDRPGVIGDVGHFLASRGVNIDSFELSRNRKGGRAMALVRIDSPLSPDGVAAMNKINNVIAVHEVNL